MTDTEPQPVRMWCSWKAIQNEWWNEKRVQKLKLELLERKEPSPRARDILYLVYTPFE